MKRTTTFSTAGAVALVLAASFATATSAQSLPLGSDDQANPPATASVAGSAAATGSHGCIGSYDKSASSIDMSITNGTDQVLTLDPALTSHNESGWGGHWGDQPAATLQPGQCDEVTAYLTDPLAFDALVVNAVYTTPSGEFVPFSVADVSTGDTFNPEVFTSTPTYAYSNGANGGGTAGAVRLRPTCRSCRPIRTARCTSTLR